LQTPPQTCNLRVPSGGTPLPLYPVSESPLTSLLCHRIAASGPISFRDFMEAALYHPELGYYSGGRAAIGRSGDFFTNVSVGPLFGKLLARQFVEIWDRMGRPAPFTIIEQGAHRGDFAHDALSGLQSFAPECFATVRYVIIEPSTALRESQQARLSTFDGRVNWHAELKDLSPFEGVHFSNELVDAFPIHRVRFHDGAWVERCVDWQDGRFIFCDAPLSIPLLRVRLDRLNGRFPEGYETEINLTALDWIEALGQKLVRGWVLLIDYGYPRGEFYRPERIGGTLSGYSKHQRVTELLSEPGAVDLTAHVDFTSLAEAAESGGLRARGFADQHHFMVGLSRLHFSDSETLTPAMERELRAFKTLMHPNMMGASFKVLGLEKTKSGDENSEPLAGFAFGGDARSALELSSSLP